MASNRARKNSITAIQQEGQSITDLDQISKAFFTHLSGLLGESSGTMAFNPARLYNQGPDLTGLGVPFTEEEVRVAVNGLASNRASGPDGITNEFLKIYWQEVKGDIMLMMHQFFEGKLDLQQYNKANVIFLSKKEESVSVQDYRPISIINILPKVIAKVLANRLSGFLPDLISIKQTAFIRGRFISENFNSTREILHHVASTKRAAVFAKIDFSKAFDSLEWGFLIQVMRARGFPSIWIGWIMMLLESASTRIMINGEPSQYFQHARGLHQGDPISPMLFILAVDVLQMMVGGLNRMLAAPISPKLGESVLALQYADDTVFVCNAEQQSLIHFKLMLRMFSGISGLQINFSKSMMVPFNMTDVQIREAVMILGCKREKLPILYLAMPLSITTPKRSDFLPLIGKFKKRLQGWKSKMLTRGGRVQLARSVLSALPIYYMASFKLPCWVVQRIDKIRRGFIWGRYTGSTKGLSLINWEVVCVPRDWGGLGLSDIHLQNISLLLR